MARILALAVLAVLLPACATGGSPYGSLYGGGPTIGGVSITDALCAGVGVGAGLGTGKATRNTGWGVLVGAGAALICKGVTDAVAGHPVYGQGHQPLAVYHQPGTVMIPSGAYVPDGYQMERIDVQNATRGVIFVRTPQGMQRVEPGGMVSFYEAISTSAGGAFYAVHATATVQEAGGYQSKWAHEFGNSNGTLARTVVFRDSRWDNKIVPAHAATRHEIVPPPAVYGAPGVQAQPAAPPLSK